MARVKNGAVTKARHKKVLKEAKGYFGSKHRLYKTAKEQLMHSGQYAFRDRKQKKRDFRKLWITRINAACRQNEISYSRFIEGLTKAGVEINRKMLSEIAINDPKMFTELVKVAKDGKAGKITRATEVTGNEVTIGEAKAIKTVKKETKKETKKEVVEDVDYSKMTVAELKEVAAKKDINVTGMKKAEIIEALSK
jgi:large subunit ribosomal protein L20